MKLACDVTIPSCLNGDLPPVVFLHGMFECRMSWKNVSANVAERTGRKVFTVDARNHGDSPWSDNMNWNIMTEDLDEFLRQHDIPQALLVGFSMGGRTSIMYASKKPHKIEKICLVDVPLVDFHKDCKAARIQASKVNKLREFLKVIPPDSDELNARRIVVNYISSREDPDSKRRSYDVDSLPIVLRGDHYEWKTNMTSLEKFLTTDEINNNLLDLPGLFKGDVLFLYGTESPYKATNGEFRKIRRLFPKAVRMEIAEVNHYIHHNVPEIFCDKLVQFILNGNDRTSKY